MGLFNKLFSKTDPNLSVENNFQEGEYEEEWEFYLTNVNDELGSIFFDIGIHDFAPLKDKPNIVWISLKMINPNENGLQSEEESEILIKIEEALIDKLISQHNSIYVGRLTSVGDRDFYFYFGDILLYEKTISEVMVAFPKYQYDYGTKEDSEWNDYFELLYPTPINFQCIQNRKVLEQLEENGDKLIVERAVDHWLYFRKEKDREAFLNKIVNDGFTVVNKDKNKDFGDTPFGLQIQRIDKVDQESVDEYVIYLWELANETNGNYDGWETSVEKD